MVLECRDKLEWFCNTHQANLVWVHGHSRIRGNEEVDELAHRGLMMDFVRPKPAVAVPLQKVKRKVKDWFIKNTIEQSLACEAGSQAVTSPHVRTIKQEREKCSLGIKIQRGAITNC